MDESILTSIKKMLGIVEDDTSFDTDIIIDINSVFSILKQIGVGNDSFSISDKTATWGNYLGSATNLELIKTYMFQKVRLMFDTSTLTSSMIDIINRQIEELEWRINVEVDPG